MEAYIKHTVDQNEAYPAGLYVALTDGSLEAARAGEAGKGFAVVAEEVRSLASRSAEAARETTVLLGETVGSIDEGTRAAQETSESMLAVVTHADEMSGLIDSIAENTSRQAEGAAEIAHGIEQISSVVDSNADNAQRSAAASEELSGQAEMLKNLVATFKIRGAEKPAVVCPLMLFPHPLQNHVPRVRILLPLPRQKTYRNFRWVFYLLKIGDIPVFIVKKESLNAIYMRAGSLFR